MKIISILLLFILMPMINWQTATDWQELRSVEGSFSVLMPGTAKMAERALNNREFAATVNFYELEKENVKFYISYIDYPEIIIQLNTPEQRFQGILDYRNQFEKLLESHDIKLNNYPGKEFSFQAGGNIERVQVYAVKNRLYLQSLTYKENSISAEDIERFFTSFKLTGELVIKPKQQPLQTYSTYIGNFVATFPGMPYQKVETIATPESDKRIHSYSLIDSQSNYYFITFIDLEHSSEAELVADKVFDNAVNNLFHEQRGKILNTRSIEFGKYPGKEYVIAINHLYAVPVALISINRFYLVGKRLYQVTLIKSRSEGNRSDAEQFLSSFKLFHDVEIVEQQKPAENGKSEPPGAIDLDKTFSTTTTGLTYPKVSKKTKPAYTIDARKNRIEGRVVLSAVFRKDGTMTDIKVIKGLGHGLDEEAIEAAAKIEFIPGQFEGKPVSVRARLEFSFELIDDPEQKDKKEKK